MTWSEFATTSGIRGSLKGDGPKTALVLHGGPGMSDYTEGLAEEVLRGGDDLLRVARYQQRGLEPSVTDGPFTLAQYLNDCCDVLDALEADRVIVAGHSWGGWLAMQIAVHHPDCVAALLLVDSLAGVADGGTGTMQSIIASRLSRETVEEILSLLDQELTPLERGTRAIRLAWPGYFADPASAPQTDVVCDESVNEPLMSEARAILANGDLEHALADTGVPSLHVIGRYSPIDPAANQATAAIMPNSAVELLDCGHFPWIEQPGSIEAATRKLLTLT